MPAAAEDISEDRGKREAGFALVAAVASILVFAALALAVMATTRRAVVAGVAEVTRARAAAAADAGLAIGLAQLASSDLRTGWTFDGRPHAVSFEGWRLQIQIVDERGKVPLNLLDDQQLNKLLEYAGLSGESLQTAKDSLLDWLDDDDDARAGGAEAEYYRRLGVRPRNGYLQTVSELRRVRGFDPAVVQRIAAIATVDFGAGSFDSRFAQPAAIRIMQPGGDLGTDEIERQREASGQVTALGFVGDQDRIGHPVSIVVTATGDAQATLTRHCVAELTGARQRPVVVRYCV